MSVKEGNILFFQVKYRFQHESIETRWVELNTFFGIRTRFSGCCVRFSTMDSSGYYSFIIHCQLLVRFGQVCIQPHGVVFVTNFNFSIEIIQPVFFFISLSLQIPPGNSRSPSGTQYTWFGITGVKHFSNFKSKNINTAWAECCSFANTHKGFRYDKPIRIQLSLQELQEIL